MKNNNFLFNFLCRLGELLLKLAGSRKAFYQLFSKVLTIFLLRRLTSEWAIIALFGITSISDWVYFQFIQFEKVKTDVKIGLEK